MHEAMGGPTEERAKKSTKRRWYMLDCILLVAPVLLDEKEADGKTNDDSVENDVLEELGDNR